MPYEVLNTHELSVRSGLVAEHSSRAELITAAFNKQKSERGMILVAIDPQPDGNLYVFRHEMDRSG